MTARKFRTMLKAQPFRPFVVRTTNGETWRLDQPDYALVSPANTAVMMYDKDGHFHHIAMNRIVSLKPVRKDRKELNRR